MRQDPRTEFDPLVQIAKILPLDEFLHGFDHGGDIDRPCNIVTACHPERQALVIWNNPLFEQGLKNTGKRGNVDLDQPVVLIPMLLVPIIQIAQKLLIRETFEFFGRFWAAVADSASSYLAIG